MSNPDALRDVMLERARQDEKWGVQNHSLSYWMLILTEEVGECSKAVQENLRYEYRKEMIQVAAVALAAVESFDRGNTDL